MKKFLLGDVLKMDEYPVCSPITPYACAEYNDEFKADGQIELGSLGYAEYNFDYASDNYVVTVIFSKGGESQEYILGGDELIELDNGKARYYNEVLRQRYSDKPPYWPFGSKDHLHWPNQMK